MSNNIEWRISTNPVEYDCAISEMSNLVSEIKNNNGNEIVWLLEHNSIFTAGTSAKMEHLKNKKVNFRHTGRGGQWTWHGHGQRIVYIMLDLKNRLQDLKAYVRALEELIIITLQDFSIKGIRIKDKPGVWIKNKNNFEKIAAIGIRISNWITFHGISINVNPNLEAFKNIVPCGITDAYTTSFHKLGKKISLNELDISLKNNFNNIFDNQGLFRLR